MAKEYTLSTGKLPLGGLSRNNVVRIIDHPGMTSDVYRGCKALIQTNKPSMLELARILKFVLFLSACNVGDEGGFAPNIQDNKEGEP